MTSRVPDNLMYQKGQGSLDRARSTMIRNQEKALTGKAVNRLSDDPVAAMKISQMTSIMNRDEAVSSNLDVAQNILTMTDASLGELTDVLSRTKELAVQMASTTNQTEDARHAVMQEVDQLMLRCVQVGNTRMGDRYIFAGNQTDRAPFDQEGNYFGDDGLFEIEMDRGSRMAINVPGMVPFFGASEIPKAGSDARQSPQMNAEPTISAQLRSPASIEVANKGLDPEDDKDKIQEIQNKSGVNLFLEVKKFSDALKTGSVEGIHESIEKLDIGFKQVLSARAMIGARQNIVKISQDSLAGQKVNNTELKSQSEDADVLQVYADLAKNENVLKSSLEINKKLITPTLLEFLR